MTKQLKFKKYKEKELDKRQTIGLVMNGGASKENWCVDGGPAYILFCT